ncbi:hypothetical protein ID866_11324 [Astraeus odoratus]|nr:hypothetical protein ID866_11324 [Astraeus odoratus]
MEGSKPVTPCLLICEENIVPPLTCMWKAIRNKKDWVTFYKSAGSQPLDLLPQVPHAYECPLRAVDLYVHHNQTKNTFQMWIWSGDK